MWVTPYVFTNVVQAPAEYEVAGNVDEARQFWLAAKKLDPENRSLDLNLKKLLQYSQADAFKEKAG